MNQGDTALKGQVEFQFGKKIKIASDCEQLAYQVMRVTNIRVSAQTIRRYWNLIHSNSGISVATKNTLSVYLGYSDFNDFLLKHPQQKVVDVAIDLDFIVNMFKRLPDTLSYNYWHESFANILKEYILNNQSVFEYIVAKLQNNASAMAYLIETYQCYHLLNNDWYLKGLRLFCYNSKVFHHQVYYDSLLCCKYLLRQNPIMLAESLASYEQKMENLRMLFGTLFPLEGVYFGLSIIVANQQNNFSKRNDLMQEVFDIIEKSKFQSFNAVDSKMSYHALIDTMVEILVWGGNYKEAEILLAKYTFNKEIDNILINSVNNINAIYQCLVWIKNGKNALAKKIFSDIDISDIRFDRKVITHTIYQLLKLGITPKTSTKKRSLIRQQLVDICAQHGFDSIQMQIDHF